MDLKQRLVAEGLSAIECSSIDPQALLAAVGDPFQALTMGVLLGAVDVDQPILLAGGSQMVAVLALALAALPMSQRQTLSTRVMLGTTAWLAAESRRQPPGLHRSKPCCFALNSISASRWRPMQPACVSSTVATNNCATLKPAM